MTTANNYALKVRTEKEVLPFRSQIKEMLVAIKFVKTKSLSGLEANEVKISEYRLEQYLNASNPSCSG